MDISDSYYYCKESGITSSMLLGEDSLLPQVNIKNGLVLELLTIKKNRSVTWSKFKDWLEVLGSLEIASTAAVQKSISTLASKKQNLQKRHNIKPFLEDSYKMPERQPERGPV